MGTEEKSEIKHWIEAIRTQVVATVVSAALVGLGMTGLFMVNINSTIKQLVETNKQQDLKIEANDYQITEMDKKVFQLSIKKNDQ